jgi:uncharacterized protein with PQ loop repeat
MLGDTLSWILGSISNLVWLFVFVPQLIKNKTTNSSDAISFYLLLAWYIGDTLSCMSVMYKNVSPVLLYVGIYHIVFDIIFMVQVIYYRLPHLDQYQVLLNESTYNYNILFYTKDILFMKETRLFLGYTVLFPLSQIFFNLIPHELLGNIFAWMSTFLFLLSRLPQILLNYKRRSVSGLSFITFVNIILANQLFLASILIKLIDINDSHEKINFIIENIPWIIGCSGGLVFDIIIFTQFIKYN